MVSLFNSTFVQIFMHNIFNQVNMPAQNKLLLEILLLSDQKLISIRAWCSAWSISQAVYLSVVCGFVSLWTMSGHTLKIVELGVSSICDILVDFFIFKCQVLANISTSAHASNNTLYSNDVQVLSYLTKHIPQL